MTLAGSAVPATSGRGGPARVVIIEDHRVVAEALAAVIASEDDLEVVGIAGTVAEGLELVRRAAPELVLMDHQLPDGNGIDATVRLRAQRPDTVVVMLTGTGTEAVLLQAVAAGCSGFLLKEEGVRRVVDVMRSALAGEMTYSALVRRSGGTSAPRPSLTPRELEVLALLAEGATTTAVRERLFLSTHTVRNHVRNIITKLGAHSKLEAVAIARRDGLV